MELIESAIRNMFEFLYYMKQKEKRGMIPAWIVICILCVGMIGWVGYLTIGIIFGYSSSFSIVKAMGIAMYIVAIIIVMNIHGEKVNIEQTIIKHMYLNKKISRFNWIDYVQFAIVCFLVLRICYAFEKPFKKLCETLALNETEILIVSFVLILSILYLALTETIIEETRRYRIKTIACVIIFLLLIIAYVQIFSDNIIGEKDINGLIVFGFSQLAFLESAIGNYRALYRCLEMKYELDLELYYNNVVNKFDVKISKIQSGLSDMKIFAFFISDAWKGLSLKKKVILIAIAFISLLIAMTIVILSNYFSGRILTSNIKYR